MPDLLTIGEVADRSGVSRSTLRYYDDIGLLPPAARVDGQRRYSDRSLRRLRTIAHCRRAGLTLAETRQVLEAPGQWKAVVHARRDAHTRRIGELRRARRLLDAALACGCEQPELCEDVAAAPDPTDVAVEAALTDPTRV